MADKALCQEILPDLFHGVEEHMPDWAIMGLLIKRAVQAIPGPTMTAQENFTMSCVVTGHLVSYLRFCEEFPPREHAQLLTNVRVDIQRQKGREAEEYFSTAAVRLSAT